LDPSARRILPVLAPQWLQCELPGHSAVNAAAVPCSLDVLGVGCVSHYDIMTATLMFVQDATCHFRIDTHAYVSTYVVCQGFLRAPWR
jgi:hypothetical protein